MFKDIFLFELKYRLKRPSTYVYAAIMLGTGLLYGAIMAGAMGVSTAQSFGGGPQMLANSPVLIHTILVGSISIAGTFVLAAFMAVPVYRDFRYDAHSLFFTKPITKFNYLAGRYAGSMLIAIACLLLTGIGLLTMMHWPWEETPKLGPFHLWHYVYPYLVSILPYALLVGSIFFATVSLSRNQLFIYLNAIIILVLFNIAGALVGSLDNKTIALLLDPTGSVPLNDAFLYWSTAEKNTQTVGFTGAWLANILIWQAVGLGILLFTYKKFQLSYGRPKLINTPVQIKDEEASPGSMVGIFEAVKLPKVKLSYELKDRWQQLMMMTGMELKRFFKSPVFWSIIGVAMMVLLLIQFVSTLAGISELSLLPVTYNMIGNVLGSMSLFIFVLIIFFSGELIWRERQENVNELYDVMPVPNWLSLTSKILALVSIPFIVLGLGIVTAIIIQLIGGYTRIELWQYIVTLFGFRMINFLLFIVLCVFIQVMVNNKFAGFFVSVLVFAFFSFFMEPLGINDSLFRYMSSYRLTYSDMNGFGPFIKPFLSYQFYWTGLAIVLLTISSLLYPRGTDALGKTRLAQIKDNLQPATWASLALGLVIFLGMGSYIYYNTHVLNEYSTAEEGRKQQALYETRYKPYENMVQPKIIRVQMDVDLFPEERDFDARGIYWITNKATRPIDTVHVMATTMNGLDILNLRFSRDFEEILSDDSLETHFFRLSPPLAPGDTIEMRFEGEYRTNGFPEGGMDLTVVENGTFFTSFNFPSLGYQPFLEISNPSYRKELGLPEKEERYAERTDTAELMYSLFARDADWIDFEATVSTSPDQIAIAPGYLQREWEENGRRYFHYKMDSPMVKFYNISSGRYTVMRDSFFTPEPDAKKVSLEIYHQPDHTYNLEDMMEGIKQSLRIYTRDFGPYQHRQVRIIEFPRYASYAQSFPNTIPSSEGVAFIADEDGDINYPYYLAAHEIAHQWWGHQLVSGNVKGFQFLIESMAQYSSLLVIEEELGEEALRDFIKNERNNYLRARSAESREENPLMLVENQFYLQYQKGSLSMYALMDYIGKDSLNAGIRRYLDKVRFQEPPFTTTLEWMEYIDAVTPDSLKYVLEDLFETITFHENEMLEATYTENADSTYTVDMKILTHKIRDDGKGNESDADPHALIDVGIFISEKVDGERKEVPLYLEKHWFDQDTTEMSLVVAQKPTKVSIDPYGKLLDRKLTNNSKKPTLHKD